MPHGDISPQALHHFLPAAGLGFKIHDRLQHIEDRQGVRKAHGVGADGGQSAGEDRIGGQEGAEAGGWEPRARRGRNHADHTREQKHRRQHAEHLQKQRRIIDEPHGIPVNPRPDGKGPLFRAGEGDFLHPVDQGVGQAGFGGLMGHPAFADGGAGADNHNIQNHQHERDRQRDERRPRRIEKHLGKAEQGAGSRQQDGQQHIQQCFQVGIHRADPSPQIPGRKRPQRPGRGGQHAHHERGLQGERHFCADAGKEQLLHGGDQEGCPRHQQQHQKDDGQQAQIRRPGHAAGEQLRHCRRHHAQQYGRDACRQQEQQVRGGDGCKHVIPEIPPVELPQGEGTVIEGRLRAQALCQGGRDAKPAAGIGVFVKAAAVPRGKQDNRPAVLKKAQHHAHGVPVPAFAQLHGAPHDALGAKILLLIPFHRRFGICRVGNRDAQASPQRLHRGEEAQPLAVFRALRRLARNDTGQLLKRLLEHFILQPVFPSYFLIKESHAKPSPFRISCFLPARNTARFAPSALHACPARRSGLRPAPGFGRSPGSWRACGR